jgi:hypothetical protein
LNSIPASKEWGFFCACHCARSKAIPFSLPVLCLSLEFPLITKIDFLSQQKGCCIVSLINLNSLMFIIYTRRDRSRTVLFKFNETIKKLRKIIFHGSSGRCCHRTSPKQSVVFHRLSKLIFYLTERLLYSLSPSVSKD